MSKDKTTDFFLEAVKRNLKEMLADSMIKKIVVKDVATYDSEGVTIDNLGKINFIYGGNGVGKTTLSRVLESKNLKKEYPKCKVEWTSGALKMLVYNKDFRERNLVENIPGVFTLGESSVEAAKILEARKKEMNDLRKGIASRRKKIEQRESQIQGQKSRLKETIWQNVYLENAGFRACLKDYETKAAFLRKIMQLTAEPDCYKLKSLSLEERDELRRRYKKLHGGETLTTKERIAMPEEELAELTSVTDDSIWKHPIIGSGDVAIGELIKRLGLEDWVRQGQQQLKDHSETLMVDGEDKMLCPFCQQHTIDRHFRQELEAFFDDTYRKDIETLHRLTDRYKEAMDKLTKRLEGHVDTELYAAKTETLKNQMESNLRMMGDKIQNPSMVVDFVVIRGTAGTVMEEIEAANRAIDAHNEMVENLKSERERLRTDVWNFLAYEALETVELIKIGIDWREKEVQELSEQVRIMNDDLRRVVSDIIDQEKNIASVQPTIDRINNLLKMYKMTGFCIRPAKRGNYYQLQREDGTLVKDTLSEGETMFITFLYYMQLVKGGESKRGIEEPRVLVIDDPISSLDSKVMYVVSEMLQDLITEVREEKNDIKQMILLTHNRNFHKQVSDRLQRTDTHYWKLLKRDGVSKVKAFNEVNPVYGDYESHWKDLKENIERGNYSAVPNLMRIIIESYFVGFGGIRKKDLIPENFSEDAEEMAIVKSLAKWMDEGSHRVSDDLYMEDPDEMIWRYQTVFKRLFDKLGHLAHYEMMMNNNKG